MLSAAGRASAVGISGGLAECGSGDFVAVYMDVDGRGGVEGDGDGDGVCVGERGEGVSDCRVTYE